MGEWAVTSTPDDPSLNCHWLGYARDALHAFDQYAESLGFPPYSELIDPRDNPLHPDERDFVCQTPDGQPWAIMTNFSVTAVLVRSADEILIDVLSTEKGNAMEHYEMPEFKSGTVFDPEDDTFGPIMAAIQRGDFLDAAVLLIELDRQPKYSPPPWVGHTIARGDVRSS
jgi:hypothetical protein